MLLVVAVLALLVARRRSAPSDVSDTSAEPRPLPETPTQPPSTGRPPFIAGADEEEVTDETLAVVVNRPFLVMVSASGRKTKYFLSPTGVTTIGRASENDIVIPEDAASARHCSVQKQGSAYVLSDLDSTNKTWVNGVAREQVVLRNGDQVTIGETTMVFALFGDRV